MRVKVDNYKLEEHGAYGTVVRWHSPYVTVDLDQGFRVTFIEADLIEVKELAEEGRAQG